MKNKVTIRATDGSTLILHCFECQHEREVSEFKMDENKCDWCGADMGVIGVGTKWYDIKQPEPATTTSNPEEFGQEIPILAGGKQISAHVGSESVQFVFSLGLDMATKDVRDVIDIVLDLWVGISQARKE